MMIERLAFQAIAMVRHFLQSWDTYQRNQSPRPDPAAAEAKTSPNADATPTSALIAKIQCTIKQRGPAGALHSSNSKLTTGFDEGRTGWIVMESAAAASRCPACSPALPALQ